MYPRPLPAPARAKRRLGTRLGRAGIAIASITYADASTQRIEAENGIQYAYRDLGRGDVPLVLLQHFRGNLDKLPNARLTIYPESAHGFRFQHRERFAADVAGFVDEAP